MTASPEHVTIATSSGALWLTLVSHFGAGLAALAAGSVALVVAKGGRWHRAAGMVFVYGMIAAMVLAAGIGRYEGRSIVGETFTAYLVFTALSTMRPSLAGRRGLNVALMALAFLLAFVQLWFGFAGLGTPGGMINGAPAGMVLFLGTVTLLAAIGDLRMILAGGIQGSRRLARHLWRMCFALFVASGSFFLGQMKFLPEPLRILPLMMALGVAPLFVLLYWLVRVRSRPGLRAPVLAVPAVERKLAAS